MSKDSTDDPITKKDVEEIVGRVVGDIMNDALQMIAGRFDKVDQRFDQQDDQIAEMHSLATRTKRKLDATVQQVDDHSVILRRLNGQAA